MTTTPYVHVDDLEAASTSGTCNGTASYRSNNSNNHNNNYNHNNNHNNNNNYNNNNKTSPANSNSTTSAASGGSTIASSTPPDFLTDGDYYDHSYQPMNGGAGAGVGVGSSGMTCLQIPNSNITKGHGLPDPCQPSLRLQDMPSHQRPTSLREFFRDFWLEIKSLVEELIEYGKAKTWKKKVLTVLLCLSSILVFYDLVFGDYIIQRLEQFIIWMAQHEAVAVLAFVGIFVLSTLIFIPPTILIFGAGYAFAQAIGFGWGVAAATLSCLIGSCIGAIIAFLRSRYMMRDMIYLFTKRYPLVRAADRALKRNGFHIMLLLRLCPIIPFNGLNYCCGITGVSLEDFTMSLIGIVPFQIFTIVVGATTGTFALKAHGAGGGAGGGGGGAQNHYHNNSSQKVGFIVLIASGCAFGFLALVYTWRLVKQELRKELELTPEQFEQFLHPPGAAAAAADEEQRQGGIEQSIEVNHLEPSSTSSPSDDGWLEEGEEWFWVWA